ncbi:MAG TPA: aminotransferase class I/II-fold pyridoxal phosphate-dependent enzyme [Phycisphaerae bacterium]|nr:aminotransferase class I/II-fold pyridoxal phosphate-dependent enzyme [Phycisphaerae bacterium]
MYEIGQAEIDAVAKVIRSGRLMRDFGGQGTVCEKLEAALAEKVGTRYALTVNSGTSALTCALVGAGIGPGDEVIVPAYTFMATALAVLAVGAVPIIAEIDESLMIDPADVERKIGRYTKAVIPVHMIGRAADMAAVTRVARRHKLTVIEDACQAVGGSYRGRRLCSIGQLGAYSFNWYKNISAGEGGAVFTSSRKAYERALIYHEGALTLYTSAKRPRETLFAGQKLRYNEVQGAIMTVQLRRLDGILRRLRARQRAMAEVLGKSRRFRLAPSNEIAGDCGSAVVLLFETAKDTLAFMDAHRKRIGMMRPYDTGKHVYSRWEPVLTQRGSHQDALNPFRFAQRKIRYSKDMCQRSLDIMARSLVLHVPYKATVGEARKLARELVE